jgi:multidrug efflux pump subunit AcrA (membrane-fusion protein)
VLVLIAAILAFPVKLTSIAPAEIIPLEPETISAAIPGVVKRVLSVSNEAVQAGALVVEMDDVEQNSRVEIARGELNVAAADLRRLTLLGFQDASSRYRLAEAQGMVEIKKLQLARAELEVERTKIRSTRSGIAVVSDPLDWQGKPVQPGERIMLVADPRKIAVRIWVPAQDGPVLEKGAQGELFLDSEPWRGQRIRIDSWSFEPEMSPFGVMAYRAQASIALEERGAPRIGLRGSAHLTGERISLLLYLIRRPLIFLRQTLSI